MMTTIWRTSLVLLGLGLVSACATDAARTDVETAATGAVALALTTTGPDGATYRLPSPSILVVSKAGSNSIFRTFSLSESEESFDFNLEAGDYTFNLQWLADQDGKIFLTRENGTQDEKVQAQLLSENPMSITVAQGGSVDVALRFAVETVGDLDFAVGNVKVHASVEDGGKSPGRGYGGTGELRITSATATATGKLGAVKGLSVGSVFHVQYEVERNGDWTINGDTACVPVVGRKLTVEENGILASLFHESEGGDGVFCIQDRAAGGVLSIDLWRSGELNDPTLRGSDLVGNVSPDFGFKGKPSLPLFENGRLLLSKLGQNLRVSEVSLYGDIYDESGNWAPAASVTLSGAVAISARL
jgi:hypothetical protein